MQQVPQFIETEDKIVGPLTWHHLYWFFGAGAILTVLWNILPKAVFWVAAVFIGMVTLVFAFYRPQGISMLAFSGHALTFFFKPRLYMWQREKLEKQKAHHTEQEMPIPTKSGINASELHELSRTLDEHGSQQQQKDFS